MSIEGIAESRYAPPKAHVDDVEASGQSDATALKLASRWARVGAIAIDTGIYALLVLAVSSFAWAEGLISDVGFWEFRPDKALFDALVAMTPNVYLLLRRGQSLGKMAMRIRIVRPDGTLPSPVRILLVRHVLWMLTGMVAGIGTIAVVLDNLFIFRRDRRCLHDLLADTIVVKA